MFVYGVAMSKRENAVQNGVLVLRGEDRRGALSHALSFLAEGPPSKKPGAFPSANVHMAWVRGMGPYGGVMLRFSACVGKMSSRLGVVLDIVLHLASLRVSQADDAPDVASINEGHVVQPASSRDQSDHSPLVIVKPIINPYQRLIPGQLPREGQRQVVPASVEYVLGWIEVDLHALV